MLAIIIALFVRPFARKGMAARRKIAADQRIAHNISRRNAARGVKVTLTPEERAYFASHVPEAYRK